VKGRRIWIGSVGAAAVLVVLVVLAGGTGSTPSHRRSAGFSWFSARPLPSSWSALRLPASPAALPLPPGWHRAAGDAGTETAELTGDDGHIEGYLNATPQQGKETLEDWSAFRPEHNRDEGLADVTLLGAAGGLSFTGARGSCVLDDYVTGTRQRYREIACIVGGRTATTVIVAAAPPRRWVAERPVLRRAIESFTT
jgi:hypothetical protein